MKGRTSLTLAAGLTSAVAVMCAAVGPMASASTGPVSAAPGGTGSLTTAATMLWNMNEGSSASVMNDSGGLGLDGHIGNDVRTGTVFGGATGYTFPFRKPNTPPPHPEHLVTVPNASALNPDSGDFSIEIRYKTTHKFGNLIQKGQATTKGGQIKIQLPGGRPSCYYKGSAGRVGAGAKSAINDGNWHTLRCDLSSWGVKFYVDGVQVGKKAGDPGVINNTHSLAIAGKPFCDQVDVTCDYFGGMVDYVKIVKG